MEKPNRLLISVIITSILFCALGLSKNDTGVNNGPLPVQGLRILADKVMSLKVPANTEKLIVTTQNAQAEAVSIRAMEEHDKEIRIKEADIITASEAAEAPRKITVTESAAAAKSAPVTGSSFSAEARTKSTIFHEPEMMPSETEQLKAEMDYFDDCCFIGDSFTEGLYMYGDIPSADFYYREGVNTFGIFDKTFRLPGGGKGLLMDFLPEKQYGTIYLLLGINELGSNAPEVFAAHYMDIVEEIQKVQPEARIIIQSIFHTTKAKSQSSAFKNELINAANLELSKLADGEHIFWLDINRIFDDEEGCLNAAYSGDGVHVKASHYKEWRDYLLENAPASPI